MSVIWRNVGPLAGIPLRGARRLCFGHRGQPIAVFRTGADQIFALIDECPHKKGPLSEGLISGETVTCPLHNWTIDLGTGLAQAPDIGATQPLPVRIENGDILVGLPEAQSAAA